MARPGAPVTTRQAAPHAEDPRRTGSTALDRSRYPPTSEVADSGRHVLLLTDRAGATGTTGMTGTADIDVRTALDLPAGRLVPAAAGAAGAGGTAMRDLLDPEVPPDVVIA
ncbi:hypothetical protein IOD16_09435 [Saccharothrix sp. 6-C]|uniref:hypothetical protein n=1 Tax=Saccharothrix sp. 6-C TaxID=2781735 RepID=UPI0019177CC0|nr:hypothetical protein [Saccharothrix sp. 6-C]QQQ78647.1 hypothetical protein IOD16_09435 [Saccharothrix sp. 6-C]